MIDSYSFGKIKVDGQVYTKDLIIFPDRIHSPWWRKSGHRLVLEDIQSVLDENPEVLVIGTGSLGRMKVDDDVVRKFREKGIEMIIEKTKTAVQKFNDISSEKKTCGAFHLTC